MRKKKVTVVLLLSFLLLLCVAPYSYLSQIKEVQVTAVRQIAYEETVFCQGVMQSGRKVEQFEALPLVVKKSYVQAGDYVTEGQKLFDVDKEKMLSVEAMDTAALNKMASSLNQEEAYSIYNAFKNISKEEIEALPDAVYATASGLLTSFAPDSSLIIPVTEPLAVISSAEQLVLEITVPEEKIGELKQGDIVSFTPVALQNLTCYGTISAFPVVLQKAVGVGAAAQTVGIVTVEVKSADQKLVGGMNVNAAVQVNSGEVLSTLPYECIRQDDGGEYIYTIQGGKACKRYVETGRKLVDCVEISNVQEVGESPVVTGTAALIPGEYLKAVGGAK